MCVCSWLTRAGIRPAAGSGANASSPPGVHPRSSRVTAAAPRHRAPASRSTPRLLPAAQHFRDAPRLRDAAARQERRLRVEDLADRADARLVEVPIEAREQLARSTPIVA